MAGINQDIQKNSDYVFTVVICGECDRVSPNFLYKESLTGDEQLAYIRQTTGYASDTKRGGFLCHKCRPEFNITAEVDGVPVEIKIDELTGIKTIDLSSIFKDKKHKEKQNGVV